MCQPESGARSNRYIKRITVRTPPGPRDPGSADRSSGWVAEGAASVPVQGQAGTPERLTSRFGCPAGGQLP
jgi:hypothetical protein